MPATALPVAREKPVTWAAIKRDLRFNALLLAGPVAVFWAVFVVDALLGGALNVMGIHPRSGWGLLGVLFAPFLHGSLAHVISNSMPFLFLGWMVLAGGVRQYLGVCGVGALTAGLVPWLVGAPGSVHIGASGVVFAFFGFLLLRGWFERSVGSVLVSLAVALFWGGLVFGVLPGQPGVSWEAHLGGFLGGALCARWFARREQAALKAR